MGLREMNSKMVVVMFGPSLIRGRHGGVEKRGGWKTSRTTPLPKRGFGPTFVRYVFHPPQVSVLCFSCTKIHDGSDQKLFWRGSKNFRESAFSDTFSSPHTLCTPPYHGPTLIKICQKRSLHTIVVVKRRP